MSCSRRDLLRVAGAAGLYAGLNPSAVYAARPRAAAIDPKLHFLSRVTFGATPEEIQRIFQIGRSNFLEEQFRPASLEDAVLARKMAPFYVLNYPYRRIINLDDPWGRSRAALIHGMVTRAIHSKAQLLERMVEFWSDHFNVPSEGLEPEYVQFQREAIRKHAFGTFHQLLLATAQSAAMLYYLDNYISTAEHPNENYAREVQELHTLGVRGGYTEQDVIEVARAFTGWTVDDKKTANFVFRPRMHDTGPKVVLGQGLPGGRGIEDGLDVIRILAFHPSTAPRCRARS